MTKPFVGECLSHPVHGRGTVTSVGSTTFTFRLDDGQERVLDLAGLEAPEAGVAWPENTFQFEAEGGEHYLGSHWNPFYEDIKEVLVQLPTLTPAAVVVTPHAEAAPRIPPEAWVQGVGLVSPALGAGIGMVCVAEEGSLSLKTLFPVFDGGTQALLRLDQVKVWEGGVEAQITATWGDCIVTLFDTRFLANRPWYERGRSYRFVLTGIAYTARPAKEDTVALNLSPEALAKLNAIARGPEDPPLPNFQAVSLKRSAIFLPRTGWDQDDYSFRGVVTRVQPVEEALGQSGWLVRVVVYRLDDEGTDQELDVLITRKVWGMLAEPVVGEDLEGELWLQGFLAQELD